MTDWADEIARAIFSNISDNWAEEPRSKQIERIAYDLRKAKADGIRETLKDCACGDCDDCFWRIEADKIERSEPLDDVQKSV